MCANCGCGVDLGSVETIFAKNYKCLDCGYVFRGSDGNRNARIADPEISSVQSETAATHPTANYGASEGARSTKTEPSGLVNP